MSKWDYDLKENGVKLRELIRMGDASRENCMAILEQVSVCCNYLKTILTEEDKDWWDYDLEDMIQDCEDTKYYLDEFDEDSNGDNIDSVLEGFYGLMDNLRVWVAL